MTRSQEALPPHQQLPMPDRLLELRQSNDVQDDAAELQRRLAEDGYLFFRGLLDRHRLLNLRREMLTLMQAGGWLVQGTDPIDGIANPDARSTEGDAEYTDVYHQVYRLQSFHEIAHSRELIDLLERNPRLYDDATATKRGAVMVSEIHGTHDAHPSGLCPFSGHTRQPDVLESHR